VGFGPDVARRRNILIGRDPRDAWAITQRICGVCTTVHALASVRAVENALQLELPVNAQYIRNMIILAHAVHDHIVHFYHLSALDWVDVTSALKADPARQPASPKACRPGPATARPNSPRSRNAWRLCRHRTTGHLHQRLLGPPGDEAAAGGEPDRRRPLSAGARSAAARQQGGQHPRRQDAAYPERRRRWRRQRTGHRLAVGAHRRTPAGGQGLDRPAQPIS
jgi:hypothetical protein